MRIILLLAVAFISTACNSQIVVRKVMAYKQPSIPGARFEGQDPQIYHNYWVFLETNKKETIKITDLWIQGKKYAARSSSISKTPINKVIHTGGLAPDTVLLFPRSTHKVISLGVGSQLPDVKGLNEYVAGLVDKYDVVIGYEWRGKKYYTWARAMQRLSPEAHQ